MRINKYVVAPIALGALVIGGFALQSDAAPTAVAPANTVNSASIVDGQVWQRDMAPAFVKALYGVYDGTVHESSLDPKLKVKVNQVGSGAQGPKGDTGATGPKGDTGATGPVGPKGDKGADAIVSVTAMSSLTNRPDSGHHGDWAKDTLTRSATIIKQSAVEASKCGATALQCYFYTGSLMDNGTFETIPGAMSPQAGTPIAGIVNGTIVGIAKFQFYADSATPDPSKVVAIADGATHPTSRWGAEFFPAGTLVTDLDHQKWGWTYQANATCEEWVNASAGDLGDITGVNGC